MIKLISAIALTIAGTIALAEPNEPGVQSTAPVAAQVAAPVATQVTTTAITAMIENLGLREGRVPSRDMPGWSKPKKVVAWVLRPEQVKAGLAFAASVSTGVVVPIGAAVLVKYAPS